MRFEGKLNSIVLSSANISDANSKFKLKYEWKLSLSLVCHISARRSMWFLNIVEINPPQRMFTFDCDIIEIQIYKYPIK